MSALCRLFTTFFGLARSPHRALGTHQSARLGEGAGYQMAVVKPEVTISRVVYWVDSKFQRMYRVFGVA